MYVKQTDDKSKEMHHFVLDHVNLLFHLGCDMKQEIDMVKNKI